MLGAKTRYNFSKIFNLTYLPTYLFIYLLASWSTVLLEKLNGLQLVKVFPAFY
jgi:hypothetical protein